MSLVGSTICNIALLRKGFSKNIAFWGTVVGFGVFNFFLLKLLIGDQKSNDDSANEETLSKKNGRNNSKNRKGDDNTRNNNNSKVDNRRKKTRGSEARGGAFARRIRGGALIPHENSNDSLITILLKEIYSIHDRHDNDPQLAFIKSIASGIKIDVVKEL